jgi:hypothetical protein
MPLRRIVIPEQMTTSRKAGAIMPLFDSAAIANDRIERLLREAENERIVRATREAADQDSPRRPR